LITVCNNVSIWHLNVVWLSMHTEIEEFAGHFLALNGGALLNLVRILHFFAR